jgi:hypothetical protein
MEELTFEQLKQWAAGHSRIGTLTDLGEITQDRFGITGTCGTWQFWAETPAGAARFIVRHSNMTLPPGVSILG